jgi:FtsP/CotA-like multicopper oxidase with cupredoxin domain
MSTKTDKKRRQFLHYSAAGAAASFFPQILLAQTKQFKNRASANFHPDVEIEFTTSSAFVPILQQGPKTAVFKYDARVLKGPKQTVQPLKNNYLGPVLNFTQGQKVRVYFNNKLDEPSVIHWHGLHVPQKSDGHPMYAIQPGEQLVYEFEVKNRAGTSFYHSHTHERTATQVYKGLAGLIQISDDEEQKLELPSGEYDVPMVLQDRTFDHRNQLRYLRGMRSRMMGFLGEEILVNGKPNMRFDVKTRAYRFRALNGSNSRIYKLGWEDGTPIIAIGTDAGLLEKPVTKPYIMLAPGERVELWLDFSGRKLGSELIMYSLPHSGTMPMMYERMQNRGGMGMGMMGRRGEMMRGGMGMMSGGIPQGSKFKIASFRISQKVSDSPDLPDRLVNIPRLTEKDVDNSNNPIPIALRMMPMMSPRLNGMSFSMNRVIPLEEVKLGSIKKIKIFHEQMGRMGRSSTGMMGGGMGMGGMMAMAHPIHLHGQQYQVLSRKMIGPRLDDYATVNEGFINEGWKDTVLVMPGEEVEIIKPFQDYKGLFLYHCHNLEHEDLGMMRQFYVG